MKLFQTQYEENIGSMRVDSHCVHSRCLTSSEEKQNGDAKEHISLKRHHHTSKPKNTSKRINNVLKTK